MLIADQTELLFSIFPFENKIISISLSHFGFIWNPINRVILHHADDRKDHWKLFCLSYPCFESQSPPLSIHLSDQLSSESD